MLEVRGSARRDQILVFKVGEKTKKKLELDGVGAGNSEVVGLVTSGNSLSKVAFKVDFI